MAVIKTDRAGSLMLSNERNEPDHNALADAYVMHTFLPSIVIYVIY